MASPQPSPKGEGEASPRDNCPLKAEQLGSVSDGGPKGLEGVCSLAPCSLLLESVSEE